MAKGERAPRRCSKCDNKPLMSQCKHTKAGQKYLENVAAALHSQPPQYQITTVPHTSLGSAVSLPPLPIFAAMEPQPEMPIPIDPRLQDANGRPNEDGQDDVSNAGQSEASGSPGKKKQKRTSDKDPYNGHVHGAQRGAKPWVIRRKHKAPEPCGDTHEAARAFAAGIGPLIERCDDLSNRTGCWLVIAAQHITAVNGMVHYTSPRLRAEAHDDIEGIVDNIDGLIFDLREARKREAVQANRKVRELEEQNRMLQEQLRLYKQQEIHHAISANTST
ncbi:hypothetical protein NMY22_g2496 [Coprinellus aureogranulatus]|nr:hypothetical protein NMY22_g2496 [Coprinellus aureogranulatus]